MTSDERREVAEELRGLRHMTYYSEEVVENIKDAIGIADPVNTFREPEDVYELLADLIDPTCRAVHQGTSMDDELVCSECGASLGVEAAGEQRFVPNFCSCCGARVVDE